MIAAFIEMNRAYLSFWLGLYLPSFYFLYWVIRMALRHETDRAERKGTKDGK